ncbi:cyclophilin-like fold protein [Collinsella intestinalis]|uniref:cyclophilin-like fold protein n=1 Tax=Collinsella intestinalis TaxID=147207 RepID=UPI00195C1340|nr:cyclophilin-like fold protein [Collinsella intestinalis]MBM6943082.1 hypothetical protein [Collinsella intestinalis]
MAQKLTVTVNDVAFAATLEDTEAAQVLATRLPMTVTMDELNGNEKYVYLDESLPAASARPGTIRAGDIMLFGSDCLVLFYETFSSGYRYTPIGRLDDASGLAEALGHAPVQVVWECA